MNNKDAADTDWGKLSGLPNTGDEIPGYLKPTKPDSDLLEQIRRTDKIEEDLLKEITRWKLEAATAPPVKMPSMTFPPVLLDKDIKKNEKLLIDIDCVRDSETGDYHLVIKAGIRIGSNEVFKKEKKELSDILFKRIKKLVNELNQRIKNKAALIELLK